MVIQNNSIFSDGAMAEFKCGYCNYSSKEFDCIIGHAVNSQQCAFLYMLNRWNIYEPDSLLHFLCGLPTVLILSVLMRHKLSKEPYAELFCYFICLKYIYYNNVCIISIWQNYIRGKWCFKDSSRRSAVSKRLLTHLKWK